MHRKICASINCAQKCTTKCKCKLCTEMDHKIFASTNLAQKCITKYLQVRSTEIDHSIAQECTNNGKGS